MIAGCGSDLDLESQRGHDFRMRNGQAQRQAAFDALPEYIPPRVSGRASAREALGRVPVRAQEPGWRAPAWLGMACEVDARWACVRLVETHRPSLKALRGPGFRAWSGHDDDELLIGVVNAAGAVGLPLTEGRWVLLAFTSEVFE